MKHHNNLFAVSWQRRFLGWCVHIFTACGACMGLLALYAIYNNQWVMAFWWLGVAVIIDAIDGVFARMIKVKLAVPEINGELLDNIIDFCNYVIVPAFFLMVTPLLPESWRIPCVIAIIFSASYQFTQIDAKTSDHFFKGFPSYWNIAVFYLFFWQMQPITNALILFILAILSFVPIKYIYPSRVDYVSDKKVIRYLAVIATIIWGAATFGLLQLYPRSNLALVSISMSYIVLYIGFSLYRTWFPLQQVKNEKIEEFYLA